MRPSITAFEHRVARSTAALRQMTTEHLLNLGLRQVVYLRTGLCNGKKLLVLYGADGEPLTMVDDVETAVEIAAAHGLEFIAVH